MVDNQNPPADADKGIEKPPVSGGTGEGSRNPEAPYQLPEKFKGKSPDEIAKAYVELETKLGDQSKSVEEARKLQEQTDTLLRAIWADPDLYRQVETGVQKYVSGGKMPEGREPSKGGEEAVKEKKQSIDPVISDVKTAQENQILDQFFTQFGYKNLDEKARKESYNKLALSLAEIVDPGGKKPIKQILEEIPLSKLPQYLENAHFIANKDRIIDHAKKSALLSNRENESATIGSFASSGKQEKGVSLTNHERSIAQKMGISEEAYAKRKNQIQSESKKFDE